MFDCLWDLTVFYVTVRYVSMKAKNLVIPVTPDLYWTSCRAVLTP